MALIKKFSEKESYTRRSIHKPVHEAVCTIFKTAKAVKILQIDTYGTSDRKFPNKVSQSIQFTPAALKELKKIIDSII